MSYQKVSNITNDRHSLIRGWLILAGACMSLFFTRFDAQAQQLSKTQIRQVMDSLAINLELRYPFPDISAKYIKMLKKKRSEYGQMTADSLARLLTGDLRLVHHDGHLRVFPVKSSMTEAIANISEEDRLRNNGYGFRSVELDNKTSTAYISIPYGFNCTQEGFEMASHFMNIATYSKYVIIDLRGNGGGAGGMGHFLASYFFEPGREIFYLDGFEKVTKNLQEYTYGYVPGKRLTNARLFILTDRHTGSAAEGFAFAMQKMHRATIVGETTGGAGIGAVVAPLGFDLQVLLPVKMLVAPGTTEGWEGTGVSPDIRTVNQDPLQVVREMIANGKAMTINNDSSGFNE